MSCTHEIRSGCVVTVINNPSGPAGCLHCVNDGLREQLRDMTARAMGHAYASQMAEGGEEIQSQELEYERRSHAQTMAQLRIYETALYSIVRSTCCEGCNEAKRVAQTALNTEPSTPQAGAAKDGK